MEKRSKRKRKSESDSVSEHTAFAVLLASLSSPQKPASPRLSLLTKCLNKLRRHVTTTTTASPLLSLLPALLTRTPTAIASNAADIVGSAALHSLEMNSLIASDADVINGLLLSGLRSSDDGSGLPVSACNALLDLCTTSVGRRCLVELSALPKILFRFLRVSESAAMMTVSLCSGSGEASGDVSSLSIGFKEDELSVLILTVAIILINTCNIEQLESIPEKIRGAFFVFLRNLWAKVRNEMSIANAMDSSTQGGSDLYISNIRVSHMAESLFRLSICAPQLVGALPFRAVERGIFGFVESGFKDLVLNHWEVSPFLMRRLPGGGLVEEDDLFRPFLRLVNFLGKCPSFLSSVLPRMVSCPPIASDELDILTFLEEVQNKLGCPLFYQQDIRVVKTKNKKEVHFFMRDPHCLGTEDVSKIEEAYKEGYTVALRGMEFRFDSVAAIADGLASLFGQPSVGANMYLTPPNSQGLACHYDDHCVFVCQLVGTKKWRVSSQSNTQLPRLYDPLNRLHGSEIQSSMDDCKQFLLKEGDIMYIPRGVLHEACTEDIRSDGSSSCSLHLTLGIEIEPPFEWEGFVHVAFFSWNHYQKQVDNTFESSYQIIHDISANLFHVAIRLIGDSDITFQKACLVASVLSESHTHNWLDLNQRTIFSQLINKIICEASFLEVFRSIELAVQENRDPLQRIRWLGFLNMEKETITNHHHNTHIMGMDNLLSLCIQHKHKVEAAFQQLKYRFCGNFTFEDAVVSYKLLLGKYKKVRKQFMNGMVSLHHGL